MTDTPATYAGMSGGEFQRAVGDDVERWAEAGVEAAREAGMTIERDWLRGFLADAMEAARRHARPVVP